MATSSPSQGSEKSRFARYFDDLLSAHGAAQRFHEKTGIPTSHITNIRSGTVPRAETLADLLGGFEPEIADQLSLCYLLDRIPPGREGRLKVTLKGRDGAPQDRLDEVLQFLNPVQRERVAEILEGALRAPEKGWAAIEAIAELVRPEKDEAGSATRLARKVKYAPAVEGFGLRVAEEPG